MLNSILANLIAGLGLFFSGLRLLDASLRQATGRQLRTIIGRLTRNPWIAGLVGILTGAVVQSSSGIVFIIVSLVSSGLTTVRRALPIVTWANVGCSALIFVAVLDLRLAILYLIGVAGAGFAFDRSHRSDILSAVFGIGMLFYGIELMKVGVEPLKAVQWFPEMLGSGQSYMIAFAGGAAFSFLTQSSTAVSIVAIGFAQTGLIPAYSTMMAIYGANVGSTFARMALSTTLKGSVRRLTAYQDLFKIAGAVLFVALLYLEAFEGVPSVHALVSRLTPRIDRQMALVFLLFNLTMAVIFSALQAKIIRLLAWWLPSDQHEDLAKPVFLYEEALSEPATALDLIDKEHVRLARRLLAYPEALRAATESAERQLAFGIHGPFVAVAQSIQHFELDLLNRQLGPEETERLTRMQSRLSLITYVEDSLRTLIGAAGQVPPDGRLAILLSSLVEAMDFVLMTMVDALELRTEDSIDLLVRITGDRSEVMERFRQEYLRDETGAGATERAVLMQVTSIFERVIWMIQRLARLVDQRDTKASDHADLRSPARADVGRVEETDRELHDTHQSVRAG
jgi:phosphate:Na+ symporter